MPNTAAKMFPGRDPDEPVCWLAFRGYRSDGSGLSLPSDLRLVDIRGEEDERMEMHHPAAAYSEKTRVWYSPGFSRYILLSYDHDRLEWHGHSSKAKSLAAAMKELEEDDQRLTLERALQHEAAEATLLRESRHKTLPRDRNKLDMNREREQSDGLYGL